MRASFHAVNRQLRQLTAILFCGCLVVMERYTPAPITLIQTIREMRPKSTMIVPTTATSIKTLVSRVRKEFGKDRAYRSGKHPKGAQVWRDR